MRASGILMHITSLPGPYGIGTMGKAAFDFIDFLQSAGQTYWQILPVGPTGYGDSPYQTYSAYAGSHYLIDLDILIEKDLLRKEEVSEIEWCEDPVRVDYGTLFTQRMPVLQLAFSRFDRQDSSYLSFVAQESFWLKDYALFMALKRHFDGKPWSEWPEGIRNRREEAMESYRKELAEEVELQQFLQFEFFSQWKAVRSYAHAHGIKIIGDIPIYVPLDSSDVWAEPKNYQLDHERRPKCVAGVPPDYFSADGQLWGNPIYDWTKMKKDDFSWWIQRVRSTAEICDVIRIDHFRGIESYWSVPYGDETARNGVWVKGPGMNLIRAIKRELPELEFIAEDLGFLTPEVISMVEKSGFPGMKVLEFAFDPREPSDYLPHTYERNCICYTGTHDNETLVQWEETADPESLDFACRYLAKSEKESLCRAVIRAGMASVSKLFIAQIQDWLELGAEARMNHPGFVDGKNWRWRLLEGQLTEELAEEIRDLTALYGRI